MRQLLAAKTIALLLLVSVAWASLAKPAQPATSGSGAFATGRYRNLFVETGHSQQEATAKINGAFQQLFHGDPNADTPALKDVFAKAFFAVVKTAQEKE